MTSLQLITIEKNSSQLNVPEWFYQDIWRYEYLGIDGYQASNTLKFSFKSIKQNWLKIIAKRYIFEILRNKSCHFVRIVVTTIGSFSEFIETLQNDNKLNFTYEIDRNVLIGYIDYLAKKNLSKISRQIRLNTLNGFFQICKDIGWLTIKGKVLYRDDVPRIQNNVPRFIPESVLIQLNENLHHLDPHVRRMLLLLQETGMRINEVFKLDYDCIFQDKDGDYFLKYLISKMNKEHIIPISNNLALTIQEQQKEVAKEWDVYHLLFSMPSYIQHTNTEINKRKRKTNNRGKKWSRETLVKYLFRFSKEHNIVGSDGKIWRFRFHSFRHTLATKMINHQVPQHIIQRFLGHESPTMTARYAHIFDETLKKEFADFQGKIERD